MEDMMDDYKNGEIVNLAHGYTSSEFLIGLLEREELVRNDLGYPILFMAAFEASPSKYKVRISVITVVGIAIEITYHVSQALGYEYKRDFMFVESGGQNVYAVLAIELSQKLYGNGYKLSQTTLFQ